MRRRRPGISGLLVALALAGAPAIGHAQAAAGASPVAAWIAGAQEARRQALMDAAAAAVPGQRVSSTVDTEEEAAALERALSELRAGFDPAALDDADLILFRGFEQSAEYELGTYRWRAYAHRFSANSGPHLGAAGAADPTVFAPPGAQQDAPPTPAEEAYIARLGVLPESIDMALAEFEANAEAGVLPPRWTFAEMIADARAAISGAPFDAGPPSPALEAAARHIGRLDIDEAAKAALLNRASAVMTAEWAPAYRRLIAALQRLEARAPEAEGLSGLPEGRAYYDFLVAANTDGAMTAAEAHDIGRRELARIHGEMRAAMAETGFAGTLEEFFAFLRTDDRFYFPDTDEGRAAYIAEARRVIDAMAPRMDEILEDAPQGALDIIRPPAALEAASPSGMYMPRGASFTGGANRPRDNGAYVLNLSDMRAAPKYLLQAMTYHEGLPGHHLQNLLRAAAPRGSAFSAPQATLAHTEGWGLYAERLPFELGLYTDPYSNIGRLGMEAWRAARLVVDTGLHAEGWTRAEVAAFLLANTPLTEGQARNEAERYAGSPGQATAYTIGLLKVLELRERARAALGQEFDLREFHGEILGHGQVSLSVLEELVDRWIAEQAAPSAPR